MSTESREKDRISFQEVAKLATTREQSGESAEANKENSGMIDFAALAASEASAKRRAPDEPAKPPAAAAGSPTPSKHPTLSALPPPPVPPPAPTAMFGIEATTPRPTPARAIPTMTLSFGATSPTLPGVGQPTMSAAAKPAPGVGRLPPPQAPRVPGPTVRTPSIAAAAPLALPTPSTLSPATLPAETTRPTAMQARPERAGGTGAVWIALGAGMGLGALLTTVFFQTRGVDSTRSTQAGELLQGATWAAAAQGGGGRTTPATDPGPSGTPATGNTAPPSDGLETPPTAEALSATTPAKRNESSASARGAISPATAIAPAAPVSPGSAPVTAAASKPSAPPISDQSLEALMKKAVGMGAQPAASPPSSPPAGTQSAGAPSGDVPLKPAMGAVQGAVGTVLPATRYCLGPDDAISHATITFASDGSVQNVAVSGPAAGQPAEACIRSRLMTARVPPFSNPSFTWTVTVRPAS